MPKARARKGGGGAEGPSKAWLDSYADAMTLLLAFFILLYASSIIDEDLFIDFKIGVAQALGRPLPAIDGGVGILDTGNGIVSLVAAPPTQPDDGSTADLSPELEEIEDVQEATPETSEDLVEALEELIASVGAEPYVDVVDDPRGVILRIDSRVLFRSGEALMLPDGVVVLGAVAPVLDQLDNLLVIEGHTDNVPTNGSQWPSNWELSTARATNVLRYLLEIEGLPAARLSASGFADTRPRDTNDTPEGRAQNRRVEVVILVQPYLEDLIPPDTDAADVPRSSDFGADIEDPAAPIVVPPNLLDLNPEPIETTE
ncbi:MAG: flagellar motor protein MotB [Actinomycetota bacterium]